MTSFHTQTPLALDGYLPPHLRGIALTRDVIPRLAKDPQTVAQLASAARSVPTQHRLFNCDARAASFIEPKSVHLVLTSPPYWTLKTYESAVGQLGETTDYDAFLDELDEVWRRSYDALVPGGRLICVVGDVCLSRRKNGGAHTVVPLHAAIQERCRRIGFLNLAPIIWYKIANASFEGSRAGGLLGKPFEPNAVIKNDTEFILMQKKPGGYRSPTPAARLLSVIGEQEHRDWFRQVWTDVPGASTRDHPAPFPFELARRLVRMSSFVGDTVLDPFLGTGTTMLAAGACGRHSIGTEVVPTYCRLAAERLQRDGSVAPNATFSMPDVMP